MGYFEQAKDRLQKEMQSGKFDHKAGVMKKAVCEALTSFCEQDEEFAQVVVQGESFDKCREAVAKGVGSSISDLEAYRKAVQFYFRGAEVHFKMEIDVCPNRVKQSEPLMLDLSDFL
jgi:hypothetical protein